MRAWTHRVHHQRSLGVGEGIPLRRACAPADGEVTHTCPLARALAAPLAGAAGAGARIGEQWV